MTERDVSSVGAPCWVDTFSPDTASARDFYGRLFGWRFDDPAPLSTAADNGYFAARHNGRLVAGIGQADDSIGPPSWRTYVRVLDLAETISRVEAAGGSRWYASLSVGRHGRLAAVTDVTGVPLWLWEAGTRVHAEVVNEPGSWAMSALHTTDLARARDFYGAVFGWGLEAPAEAPFAYWRLHDQVVAVATETAGTRVPAHWSVNFAVHDTDALAERAVRLGGRVLIEPFDSQGFRNTVIADPHGAVLAASARSRHSGDGTP